MNNSVPNKATRILIEWRYRLLAIVCLLVCTAWWLPTEVDFDRNVANMISDRSGVLEPFLQLKRTFGGNEIVLAVYQDPGLLAEDHTGIDRLMLIRKKLEQIEGVRSALSLDKLSTRLIPISSKTNSYSIRMRELFRGYTHNERGDVAVVVCMLEPEEKTKQSRRETIDELRNTISNLPDGLMPGMLTGEPVMLVDGYRYVEQDGLRLGRWSTLLLGLTLLFCFRNLRWMLICIAVVQLSLMITKLTMALLGLQLSMVSSMLTAVVTVVAVATVVHLIVNHTDALKSGRSPLGSLITTIQILFVPVCWACITDAVGFVSLKSASVGPVGEFGVMMAISCLAVLASVWLLVPSLSTVPLPYENVFAPHKPATWLRRLLAYLAVVVDRNSGVLAWFSLAVILLSLVGLQFLDVETDFTKNFRDDAEIVKAYNFVENQLGGAGVGDILVPAPESLSWEYLRHVRKFEERLMEEAESDGDLKGLTKVLSLADAVLVGAPGLSVDKSDFQSETFTRVGLTAMRAKIPAFYDALYAADPDTKNHYYLRIMFRAREQQDASAKRRMIERIQEVGEEYFGDQKWGKPEQDFSVTGFYVLLTSLIHNIVGDQYSTFMFALLGIGSTMLIAFRSIRLTFIALVPNALPVLVVSGLMGWLNCIGWFDFKINMGSAMIAAVSLGLSIDSSIHYIFAFQRSRKLGRSIQGAIRSAHETVGQAMIFATVALIVGFAILATSNFTPTVYFGTLVSLAMLGGLLGNLVILPVLIRLVMADDETTMSETSGSVLEAEEMNIQPLHR